MSALGPARRASPQERVRASARSARMGHVLVVEQRQELAPAPRRRARGGPADRARTRLGGGHAAAPSAAPGRRPALERRPRWRAPWSCWASIQSWVASTPSRRAASRASTVASSALATLESISATRAWAVARPRAVVEVLLGERPVEHEGEQRARGVEPLRERRRRPRPGGGCRGRGPAGSSADLDREVARAARSRPSAPPPSRGPGCPCTSVIISSSRVAAFCPAASASKSVTTSSA